VVEEDKKIN
jgi:chromosome segregation ATPase